MPSVSGVLQRCFLSVALLVAAVGFADADQPAPAAAGDVGDFIGAMGNQAIEMIRSNRTLSEKLDYFRLLLRQDFDLVAISQFLLGPYWRVASEAERQEFQNALVDYLVRSSGERLAALNAESLKVTGTRAEPATAIVTSQLIQSGGGPPVQLVWRLDVRGGRYRIIDVSIDGESYALSERAILARLIQRHGGQIFGLLEAMRAGET
jgi:phospholipid transport system substrate-binding protein